MRICISFYFFAAAVFALPCFVFAGDAAGSVQSFIEYPPYGSDDWERSTVGNQKILVVPVLFSDVKNSTTINHLGEVMENLSKYYYTVSYGRLNLTYAIAPWVSLDKPVSFYGADGGFENKSSLRVDALNNLYYRVAVDAVKSADDAVDFSGCNHLMIVHAGSDQAENQSCRDCIWSVSMPSLEVETNDRHYLDGGRSYPAAVNYAVILSESDSFGSYAHELGHELGLPDLYDEDNDSGAAGFYDLMDGGAWTGSNFGAWSKLKLKFADEVVVYNEKINLTIYPVEKNNSVVKIIRGNPGSWQYYLVEFRKKEGYDAHLPVEGVLVFRIDESFMDNKKSTHKPMVEVLLFNESGNFIDEPGGVFMNVTLNQDNANASLSILSAPTGMSITNRVLTGDLVKPVTCKKLDVYNRTWPENNPQYIALPIDETDYFTTGDPEVIVWAKVNTNAGDKITFEFIKNSNFYKNVTIDVTKNISRNTYNYWNWYIDPVHASLRIDSSMVGEWSVKLWVNGIFYYLNNFTITDKTDLKPPGVNLFSLPQNVSSNNFTILWNAKDSGENASGLKNYVVDYYDNDSSFFGKDRMLNYTTGKTNATFYGSRGHTYCFRVTAFDRAENHNNSEIKCASLTGGDYLSSGAETSADKNNKNNADNSESIPQENKTNIFMVIGAAVIIIIILFLFRKKRYIN